MGKCGTCTPSLAMSYTGICFLRWKMRAEKIEMEATPAKFGLAKLFEQES
jgi:hypothetical protein